MLVQDLEQSTLVWVEQVTANKLKIVRSCIAITCSSSGSFFLPLIETYLA